MEEEYDFSSLFERSQGDYAGSILERLFGGIVPFLQTGDSAALGTGNWLSAIFGIFNTAGLLAVMIVLSYTVYTAIFETAADGKTFGQQTDTKYTILRTLLGFSAFVPVAGGYSLIQVVMLWIVLQGSALADVVWTRTADAALSGQPLLAAAQNSSPTSMLVQRQFATAYDALVTGHICAINANSIAQTLLGDGGSGGSADPRSGPLLAHSTPAVEERASSGWLSIGGRQTVTLNHVLRFQEADGSTAYGGRQNFCGGVENAASIAQQEAGTYSFGDQVVSVRVRAQFENYIRTINQLSSEAQSLAYSIYSGQRNVQQIQEQARRHIRAATNQFLSGSSANLAFSTNEANQLHQHLLDEATEKGWVFAPAWQRGISMGASFYGAPDADLSINAHRENNVAAFLSGQGLRTGFFADASTRAMLAKAEDDERVWNLVSSYIEGLGDPEAQTEDESYQGLTTRRNDAPMLMNVLYTSLLNLFNPVTSSSGNSGYVDPMVQVTHQGRILFDVGGAMSVTGFAVGLPSAVPFLGGFADSVSGVLTTAGVTLAGLGFIIGTIVPMIPLVFFYSAVASWVLLVVESLFAVSLAVLTLFAPARDGQLIGSWNKILLSIFGIFFRPFFTVVGLIFSMMVISFLLQYLYDLFYVLIDFVPLGDTIWAVVSLLGFVAVYVMITALTVVLGSQLVTELGDGAMNWLGVTFGSFQNRMNVGETLANSSVGRGLPGRMNPALGGRLINMNKQQLENRSRLIGSRGSSNTPKS